MPGTLALRYEYHAHSIRPLKNQTCIQMKTLNTMYLSILIILAGTFFRFVDLSSSLIEWTSNILLLAGSVICLLSVFAYIRPNGENV